MNKNNFDKTTEENFLKNKAKRKSAAFNRKKKSAGTKNAFKITGIVLASLLGVILAVLLGMFIYISSLDESIDSIKSFSGDENADKRATSSDGENGSTEGDIDIGNYKYYTFLATATDASGNLTDVIMVARFHYPDDPDFEGPEVSVLQIPRDTYVKISSKLHLNDDGTLSEKNFDPKSGTYATKINSVFAHGRSLARTTVNELLDEVEGKSDKEVETICKKKEYKFLNLDIDKVKKYSKSTKDADKKEIKANILKDFGITYLSTLIYHYFGIPIDYQAQVNISGFRGIVDAIGGVDLDVPRRMYYKDPYQDLYIDLYPGYQHLDGKKAEQFVRFRSYARGDIDRLDAQKLFINAFLDKLLSPSTITKIDDIIVEIQENLYTEISFNDLLRFAKKVLKMDLTTDIALHTLPGTGEYVGNVSYFIAYREESLDLINKELNVYDEPFEESDLKMIDYNDVLSGKKPAVSNNNTLAASPSETPKENASAENKPSSAESTPKANSTDNNTTAPVDDNSSDVTTVPELPEAPVSDTPVIETEPSYSEDDTQAPSDYSEDETAEAPSSPSYPVQLPEQDTSENEEPDVSVETETPVTEAEPDVFPEEPVVSEQPVAEDSSTENVDENFELLTELPIE